MKTMFGRWEDGAAAAASPHAKQKTAAKAFIGCFPLL
jgi:hypothetical protein